MVRKGCVVKVSFMADQLLDSIAILGIEILERESSGLTTLRERKCNYSPANVTHFCEQKKM